MHNGLNWIFNRPRADVKNLPNKPFQDKIIEYRALQSGLGPSNIRIVTAFITNGSTSDVSDEFKQELKAIIEEYDNGTLADFKFEVCGADELVALLNIQERQNRKIDAEMRMLYDANNPLLIKYYSQDLKGLVCAIPASEIARLVNSDPSGSIFDLNIRRFLGTSGAVNTDILATCTQRDISYQFWFLNNGITIVCDYFDPVTDPDNPVVKVKNMQIVNGCQTATTLALAQREGKLAPDVRVLVRIYETSDNDLVNKIVLTTNNQNKISSRDLRANDPMQQDMQRAFRIYNYYYERKPREFDNQSIPASRVLPNETVAQAYLAIVLKTPSDARRRKYKVWGEMYAKIFGGHPIEPYIIATLIVKYTEKWLRAKGYTSAQNELNRKIAKNGAFHIARIASFFWRGDNNWKESSARLKEQLNQLEGDPAILDNDIQKALELLVNIVKSNKQYLIDLDTALKSYTLDENIDKNLYPHH
jgi:hypothetical protein